jgi:ribonuclease-3
MLFYNLNKMENFKFIKIKNENIYLESITHKSYSNENYKITYTNERLKFFGDSILNMIINNVLFKQFPKESSGVLTKYKSKLINEETLSDLSKKIHLDKKIKLGKGANVKRNENKVLVDFFKSYIAALFIDNNNSYQIIYNYLEPVLLELIISKCNPMKARDFIAPY